MDRGPIYIETVLDRFPVEPWNTASNLIFLFIIFYFWRKMLRTGLRPPLLLFGLPVLFVGFIGGTVYHATRSHNLWLFMDFIPIFVLAIAASFHFWLEIVHRKWLAALLVILPVLLLQTLRAALPISKHLWISMGYAGLAVSILLPAVIHCALRRWAGARLLIMALLFFVIALLSRITDPQQLLPMGTHFLWHIFGGLSTFCMLEYVLRASQPRAEVN